VARDIALLVNPAAGKGRGSRTADLALPRLTDAGFSVRRLEGRDGEESAELARRAGDDGIEERFEARERTDAEVARRQEAGAVRSALATLPPDQVQVLELAYFGGFTHTEIAGILDAPVGTVKGRMRLGLKKMRAQLGEGQVLV